MVGGADDLGRAEDGELSSEAGARLSGLQISAARAGVVRAGADLGVLSDVAIGAEVEGVSRVGVGLALGVVGKEGDGEEGRVGAVRGSPEGSSDVTRSDEGSIGRGSRGHSGRSSRRGRGRGRGNRSSGGSGSLGNLSGLGASIGKRRVESR